MASRGSSVDGTAKAPPVLLLMDSPRKDQQDGGSKQKSSHQYYEDDGIRKATLVAGARPSSGISSSSDSLGRLLVEMTAQVQDERSKRSDVDKKNHSLMLEIEQLQKELLDMKTSKEQQTRRRASEDWDAAVPGGVRSTGNDNEEMALLPRDGNAEFWWSELQEAKKGKDKAISDAHQRAMEVMELNACISMQHDELKALRASESDGRFALSQAEDKCKELFQQHTIVVQENHLLKDELTHLNSEIGKRGTHFKALMDKWTESQAQSEHLERENRAMLEKMKEIRAKQDHFHLEMQQIVDERDSLQHQVNHLKGAVAAKVAESKAFQAYGSNARDHLQSQHAMIQRHQIYRRKVHSIARDSVILIKNIKTTLTAVRAPLVTIQADFKLFLKNLQTPVLSLVARSRKFAEAAHVEHQPLRMALLNAELTRRHLHEQLWKARRNALLVCQIRNVAASAIGGGGGGATLGTAVTTTADSILAMSDPLSSSSSSTPLGTPTLDGTKLRTLRANYGTSELLLRESDCDTVTIKCDAVFSDRSRGYGCWNNYESVTPLLESVLDGFNGCVATFDGLLPIKLGGTTDPAGDMLSVSELMLTQLFTLVHRHGAHFHRVKLTISFLGVYNETIYDLLGMDPHDLQSAPASGGKKVVVLEVQDLDEALLVLRGGCENLDAAHELHVVDKLLTHKVITVCVVHENLLLVSDSTTKSKLQIVELATAPQSDGTSDAAKDWEDTSKIKAHVAAENGIQALVTTLTDVRVAGDGGGGSSMSSTTTTASTAAPFVRYHSSKLTVLLQDTVKPTAKFLAILALPGSTSSAASSTSSASMATTQPQAPQLDARTAQATRWLHRIRMAIGSSSSTTATHGPTDRSVEGFINRFNQQSHADRGSGHSTGGGGSSISLAFSSSELVDKQPQMANVDPKRWEKELDNMHRRYGDLTKFTTTFYQPALVVDTSRSSSSSRGHIHSHSESHAVDGYTTAMSPRRASDTVVNADQLTDVVIRPHELVPVDNFDAVDLVPPPASTKTTRSKSKVVKSRVQGHRNGSSKNRSSVHTRPHSMSEKPTTYMVASELPTGPSAVTTLAPRVPAPTRVTSIVKLRRETTSSALRKANSVAMVKPQSASFAVAPAVMSNIAAVSRLSNRKIPFK